MRLFLALWPDEALREQLVAAQRSWRWPAGAARVPPERLHLTLHFLGEVSEPVARALSASLPPLAAPFTLRLDRAALWPQGIAVLEACERTAGLAALHADLASQLRLLGLPVQTRPLRPHVTLARHAQGAQAPDSLAAIGGPIEWRVEGYALVHSIAGPPLCYQPIARV